MGVVVAILLAILTGVGVASGVSAVVVEQNQPDAEIAATIEGRADPVVIDYGSK